MYYEGECVNGRKVNSKKKPGGFEYDIKDLDVLEISAFRI